MLPNDYFEMILDNVEEGMYVLDDKGNFLFVNSKYIDLLNIPRDQLINSNVHSLQKKGMVTQCISDSVYEERRKIVCFQDIILHTGTTVRLLIVSTPIFNEWGSIQNIVTIVRPLDSINDNYHEAAGQNVDVSRVFRERSKNEQMVAESREMRNILAIAESVAAVDSAVLLSGESGTGKEVVAQYIHNLSPRKSRRMMVINCAALSESLLEAELFGYDKGSFTGASMAGKAGLIEEADGSTLFLDEINSMPLAMQSKLLRAIETKQIRRVGATKSKQVDFRLITATNEDLPNLIKEKGFRSDLYYRLNVIPIKIPPLRERKEDIVPLALNFLKHYCVKYGKNKAFTERTMSKMLEYEWPGNVRELKNCVERSVIMCVGDYIEISDIKIIADGNVVDAVGERSGKTPFYGERDYVFEQLLKNGTSLNDYLEECAGAYVDYSLRQYGSSYKAAKMLGTSQSSVIRIKNKAPSKS